MEPSATAATAAGRVILAAVLDDNQDFYLADLATGGLTRRRIAGDRGG